MTATPAVNAANDNDVRVRDFLADNLALWRVADTVEAGELPTVAVIRANAAGAIVWIERPAQEDMPFRWLVRSRGTDRARPCASLVGLLNAVRRHHHQDDITSFCIVCEEPPCAVTLALVLSALAENCGSDLLRMKGIVRVAERPDRPAVIHGVQHVYHAAGLAERVAL